MDFSPSPRAADLTERVRDVHGHRDRAGRAAVPPRPRRRCGPATVTRWQPLPLLAELQAKARAQGLWNLFLPKEHAGEYAAQFGTDGGEGLTNVDYAPIAELTGRSVPRAVRLQLQRARHRQHGGAAEVRHRRSSAASGSSRCWTARIRQRVHDDRARRRLLRRHQHGGDRGRRRRRGRHQRPQVVVDRRRPPGLQDPRVHGAHRPRRRPAPPAHDGAGPARHPGREGRADALGDGHARRAARPRRGLASTTCACRWPTSSSARAGRSRSPRAGSARAACTTACGWSGWPRWPSSSRSGAAPSRTAFGKPLVNLGGNRERIADARIAIDQARLLVLQRRLEARHRRGRRTRCREVSQIKVAVPNMAQQVIDMAMQLHGGGGLSDDFPLAGGLGQRPCAAAGRRSRRGAPRRGRPARARRSTAEHGHLRVLVTGGASGLGAALVAALRRARRRGARPPTVDRGRRRRGRRRRTPAGSTSPPTTTGPRPGDWVEAALGRRSTCWSTTPASPAAAGSTCATHGRVAVDHRDQPVRRGPRHPRRSCRCSRRRAPAGSSTSPRSPGLVHPPGMGSYNAVKAARGGVQRDRRPRARAVRRRAARWSARRTSGPT